MRHFFFVHTQKTQRLHQIKMCLARGHDPITAHSGNIIDAPVDGVRFNKGFDRIEFVALIRVSISDARHVGTAHMQATGG